MDDVLSDFTEDGHLKICTYQRGIAGRAMAGTWCTRDCGRRLAAVAARQASVLRGEPCPTCTVGPSRETVGMVCQTCHTDYGVSRNPPECEGHNETQKRDRNPPWCSRCGWNRGRPAVQARKYGTSSAERDMGHRPWNPITGYRNPLDGMRMAPPRSSMGDGDGEPNSTHQRATICVCGHEQVRHQDASLAPECLDCSCTGYAALA